MRGHPRKLGELTHRRGQAEDFARYAESTIATIKGRIDKILEQSRPRAYYGRGPRGLETDLGGSIKGESIGFLGAQHVAAERRGGIATVSAEQVLAWNPDVIITIETAFAAAVKKLLRHSRDGCGLGGARGRAAAGVHGRVGRNGLGLG